MKYEIVSERVCNKELNKCIQCNNKCESDIMVSETWQDALQCYRYMKAKVGIFDKGTHEVSLKRNIGTHWYKTVYSKIIKGYKED